MDKKLEQFAEKYKEELCNKLPERVNKNLKENRDKKIK